MKVKKVYCCGYCEEEFTDENTCKIHENNCNYREQAESKIKNLGEVLDTITKKYKILVTEYIHPMNFDGDYIDFVYIGKLPNGNIIELRGSDYESYDKPVLLNYFDELIKSYLITSYEGIVSQPEDNYCGYIIYNVGDTDSFDILSRFKGRKIRIEAID